LATAAKVLSATDEAFQPASDLLRAHYPQFHPRSFAKSGQLYDGWETRRHNLQPPDSATILLCCPTTVVGVDVCTANFSGNHSQAASVLGLLADEDTVSNPRWVELLAPSETNGNCSNIFDCVSQKPVIAVTLRMYPDGGIARLRIFGHEAESSNALSNPSLELIGKISQIAAEKSRRLTPAEIQAKREAYVAKVATVHGFGVGKHVHPSVMIHDPPRPRAADPSSSVSSVDCTGLQEVAGLANGGKSIACSNRHYSDSSNLIQGGRAVNMGDGWETRRARAASVDDVVALDGPVMQYQWAAFELSRTCTPVLIVIDTEWNPNNSPVCASVEWLCAEAGADATSVVTGNWQPLVPPSLLQPCEENVFRLPQQTVSHLLIKTYPCGGLCRFKVFATSVVLGE
jgi:allantoicase